MFQLNLASYPVRQSAAPLNTCKLLPSALQGRLKTNTKVMKGRLRDFLQIDILKLRKRAVTLKFERAPVAGHACLRNTDLVYMRMLSVILSVLTSAGYSVLVQQLVECRRDLQSRNQRASPRQALPSSALHVLRFQLSLAHEPDRPRYGKSLRHIKWHYTLHFGSTRAATLSLDLQAMPF